MAIISTLESISNLIFKFNDAQILFGMFQGFKKRTPHGGARKLRLNLPPVRRVNPSEIFGQSKISDILLSVLPYLAFSDGYLIKMESK